MHFSIIIPCFNAEKTLARALDSLLIQKDLIKNIILIDDGSKDNTAELAKKYIALSPKLIEYHYQENHGPGQARNHGMQFIKGEYTLFTDADDATPEGTLERFIKAFAEFPETDLFLAGYRAIHGNEQRIRLPESFQNNHQLLKALWFGKFTLCGATVAMKSSILSTTRYPEQIRHSEDTVFFSHLLAHFSARTLPFVALDVYHSPTSLRHENTSSLAEKDMMVELLFDEKILPAELLQYKNQFQAKRLIALAKIANKSKNKEMARECLEKAFRLYRRSLFDLKFWKEGWRSRRRG